MTAKARASWGRNKNVAAPPFVPQGLYAVIAILSLLLPLLCAVWLSLLTCPSIAPQNFRLHVTLAYCGSNPAFDAT